MTGSPTVNIANGWVTYIFTGNGSLVWAS
jgi:hypothetical protein